MLFGKSMLEKACEKLRAYSQHLQNEVKIKGLDGNDKERFLTVSLTLDMVANILQEIAE